ncbi:MFS transporter [Amycolatopsis sp. GM8]|uniref:MFS transporter n=1 Tax=Amycolatopsis sp. GM8 TaxID=2896530 RepID=UPI001F01E28B|nr:MFS transporter [Amycolatopsis sp. GM8]
MTESAIPKLDHPARTQGATRGRGPLIAVTAIIGFSASAVMFMLTPLLPVLQQEFHLSVGDIAWVLTLLLIGGGVSTILLPRSADVLGDRGAATLGTVLLAIGAAIPGIFGTYPALLAGAGIMGLGTAASQVGVGTLRRHLGEASIRTAVTVTQVAQAVGAGVGLVAGGLSLSHLSMQGFFLGATVVYAVVTLLAWVVIPSGARVRSAGFGIGNLAVLVAWIVALLYGIKSAAADGITEPKALGFGAAGLAGAAVWIFLESRSSSPVFKLELLKSPTVARTVLAGFTIGLAIQSVTFLIPFYVQMSARSGYGFGYDALDTGLVLLPYSILGAVGGVAGGLLIARTRPLLIAGFGAICHATAAAVFITTISGAGSVVVAASIYGVGGGLVGVGLFGAIQKSVPRELAGMGTSMIGIILTISGALGPAVYSSILQAKSVAGLPGVPAQSQFFICFAVAGICDLVVAAVCLTARPRPVLAAVDQRSSR